MLIKSVIGEDKAVGWKTKQGNCGVCLDLIFIFLLLSLNKQFKNCNTASVLGKAFILICKWRRISVKNICFTNSNSVHYKLTGNLNILSSCDTVKKRYNICILLLDWWVTVRSIFNASHYARLIDSMICLN